MVYFPFIVQIVGKYFKYKLNFKGCYIMVNINDIVMRVNDLVWGWPTLAFFSIVAVYTTFMLRGVQFKYFFTSWKLTFFSDAGKKTGGDMSPLQSFMNALSASIGNGSIAGIATAVYAGGPGVAFWIFVMGIFSMAIRFAEVYLSSAYVTSSSTGSVLGGPMIYLKKVPGGTYLASIFAFFCLLLSLASGTAMQANSISVGLVRTLGISPMVVALVLFAFIVYVTIGGAERIVKVSDKIVPVKVGTFFITASIVLGYHWDKIIPALKLIYTAAFTPQAVMGGVLGLTIQNALRFGVVRALNASEAGLGTAGILFGGSGSREPVKNGIMGMLGVFMTANLICFSIALLIIASGVWNNGQTGADLTISAYETVFGSLGSWLVTFLAISFGVGTIVAYAYISRACWTFLTNGRWMFMNDVIFCLVTLGGALARVEVVWNAVDIVNAGLVVSNLIGIIYLLPEIQKGLSLYKSRG